MSQDHCKLCRGDGYVLSPLRTSHEQEPCPNCRPNAYYAYHNAREFFTHFGALIFWSIVFGLVLTGIALFG